jgi:MFS family permease
MAEATEEAAEQASPGWLGRPVASLSFPHFRLFWLSNLVVGMGMMVQFTARGWLIVDLTKSAFLLGAVDAAWALAAGLGSIPMGVVADRVNRRNLLAAGNVVILSSALVIGLLVATGLIAIWCIIVAAGLEGLLFAGRMPAGQAMTARLVPEENLMNAVSLNSASHSLPSIAGPAVGGVLVAGLGIAAAYFTTAGALFVALLLMLAVAASFGSVERDPTKSVLHDVSESWAYLRAHRDLIRLTLAMMIPFVLGQSYVLLLPLFVEKELHSGPQVFGALSACLGAGSVIGATAVATFGKQRQIGLLMFLGVLGTGLATIVYSLSQWPALTGAVLFGAGIAEATLFAAYETLLVVRLPDAMRGRVLGLLFTIIGVFPASAMVAGAIADVIGMRPLAMIEGVIIVAMAYVAWRVTLRQAVTSPEPLPD